LAGLTVGLGLDSLPPYASEKEFWSITIGYPSPCFAKVLILKGVKVVCFDVVLEVLILKVVRRLKQIHGDAGLKPGATKAVVVSFR
jgi:hypothetical protein